MEQSTKCGLENRVDAMKYWRINRVKHKDSIYQVDLAQELNSSETLLADLRNQDFLEPLKRSGFSEKSMPFYHSLFTTLYLNRDKPEYKEQISEIRSFIQEAFCMGGLIPTSTRIIYNSSGKDIVMHNYKMPGEYTIHENIKGCDAWVINPRKHKNYKPSIDTNKAVVIGIYDLMTDYSNDRTGYKKFFRTFLGADNRNEINDIYFWLTGRNAHIGRINFKPKVSPERIAVFGTDDFGIYLSISASSQDVGRHPHKLWIRAAKIK